MPVGHGGSMSSHPAWVKIIILELLEERLKDAAAAAGHTNPDDIVKVFDPYTTEMDFYIWLDVSWKQYLMIYHWYYNPDLLKKIEGREDRLGIERVQDKYKSHPYWSKVEKVIEDRDDENQIFNASTSNSTIFYTIKQMKNILKHGTPYPEKD